MTFLQTRRVHAFALTQLLELDPLASEASYLTFDTTGNAKIQRVPSNGIVQ